jgi:acetyl-CoA carboxylase biotin carboxyl carrier protein
VKNTSKTSSDKTPDKTQDKTPAAKASSIRIESDLVRQLATVLDETNLTEVEYESGGLRIRVARGGREIAGGYMPAYQTAAPAAVAAVAAAEPVSIDPAHNPGAVKSPMVGVVYLLPEPGAAQFVKVGDQVVEGQTLLLVEAMKTFNPVKAPRAGKVTAILVETGAPVEYGEPLLIII